MLRGNIRVLCRVRPLPDSAAASALEYTRQGAILVQDKRPHEFEFDAIFPPAVDQVLLVTALPGTGSHLRTVLILCCCTRRAKWLHNLLCLLHLPHSVYCLVQDAVFQEVSPLVSR